MLQVVKIRAQTRGDSSPGVETDVDVDTGTMLVLKV